MELISVIIITYKRPIEILRRAVESVLRQTYTNIEIIIVNDAPDDFSTCQDIKRFIERKKNKNIKYIEHEQNMGANYARNTGLNNARGKYIAFLDDDDEWLPDKLQKQKEKFQLRDNMGLVYCGFYIQRENEKILRNVVKLSKPIMPSLLESNFIGSTSFPLLLRSAVLKVGGFDVNQKSCQEYELWIRLLQNNYRFDYVDEPLGIYYISSDSTFKNNYNSYIAGDNAILCKHQQVFEKYPIAYSNHLLNMCMYMLKERQYFLAFKYKLRAWKACPYNINNFMIIFFIKMFYKKWK